MLKELVTESDLQDATRNPICDKVGYQQEIWKLLPQLEILNGKNRQGKAVPTKYKNPTSKRFAQMMTFDSDDDEETFGPAVEKIQINTTNGDKQQLVGIESRIKNLISSIEGREIKENADIFGPRMKSLEDQVAHLLKQSHTDHGDSIAHHNEQQKIKEMELKYTQQINLISSQLHEERKQRKSFMEKLRLREDQLAQKTVAFEDFENIKESSRHLRVQISDISKQKASIEQSLKNLQSRYSEAKTTNQNLINVVESQNKTVHNLQREIQCSKDEIDELKSETKRFKQEIDKLNKEKCLIQEESQACLKELEQKLIGTEKEKSALLDALAHSNSEILNLKSSLQDQQTLQKKQDKELER